MQRTLLKRDKARHSAQLFQPSFQALFGMVQSLPRHTQTNLNLEKALQLFFLFLLLIFRNTYSPKGECR